MLKLVNILVIFTGYSETLYRNLSKQLLDNSQLSGQKHIVKSQLTIKILAKSQLSVNPIHTLSKVGSTCAKQ